MCDFLSGLHSTFGNFGADTILVGLAGQIFCHFADHIFVSGFLEIGFDHLQRIGTGFIAGFSENFGSPQAQQLVGAGIDFELGFGIMGKFVFKGVFAIIEGRHLLAPQAFRVRQQITIHHPLFQVPQ